MSQLYLISRLPVQALLTQLVPIFPQVRRQASSTSQGRQEVQHQAREAHQEAGEDGRCPLGSSTQARRVGGGEGSQANVVRSRSNLVSGHRSSFPLPISLHRRILLLLLPLGRPSNSTNSLPLLSHPRLRLSSHRLLSSRLRRASPSLFHPFPRSRSTHTTHLRLLPPFNLGPILPIHHRRNETIASSRTRTTLFGNGRCHVPGSSLNDDSSASPSSSSEDARRRVHTQPSGSSSCCCRS